MTRMTAALWGFFAMVALEQSPRGFGASAVWVSDKPAYTR
jgi:hypothetical protein